MQLTSPEAFPSTSGYEPKAGETPALPVLSCSKTQTDCYKSLRCVENSFGGSSDLSHQGASELTIFPGIDGLSFAVLTSKSCDGLTPISHQNRPEKPETPNPDA